MQTEKLLGKSTCESRQSFQKQNCEENASNEDYDNRLIKKKARAKKNGGYSRSAFNYLHKFSYPPP